MRRHLLTLVVFLVAAPAWAAQPSVVETITKQMTLSEDTISLSITAGNGYGVLIIATSGANRTYTSTSDVDGAMATQGHYLIGTGAASGVQLFATFASTGGTVTVTVDQSSTLVGYDAVMFEFTCPSGVCSLASAGSDGVTTLAATTHFMAPSGELDLAADTLWVGACGGSANFGTRTPTTGFQTDTTNLKTNSFWQYEDDNASGFTDERGQWTSSSTRDSYCRAWGIVNSTSTGRPKGLSGLGTGL